LAQKFGFGTKVFLEGDPVPAATDLSLYEVEKKFSFGIPTP
tara:strand:- start:1715 stop:1837 length:123 start_codon:yes stop_codon:yes gene_type:complete